MLGRYMAGAVAARTGNEMAGPALLVLGLAVTDSAVVASSLLSGLTVSAAVGGPLLGVMLDRARRPGLLLAASIGGYAAGLALIIAGVGRAPHALLVALAVLAGLLGPALAGGWTAQLPLVSPPERLPRSNALDAMTYNVAGLAGPAVVGVITMAAGALAAALASVALVLASTGAAWMLPRKDAKDDKDTKGAEDVTDAEDVMDGNAATGGTEPARPRSLRAELTAGFAAIARKGSLRRATVTSMITMVGVAMLVVAAPLLGEELTGEVGYGAMLLAVVAVAGLAANAVLARITFDPDRMLLGSTLVIALSLALAAAAGSYWVAVVAAVVAGVGEGPQLTALFAIRHREAPGRLRSQIFTTGASLKITSFAVGSALAGPLVDLSPSTALLAGAGIMVVAALAYALLSRP
ncbi:MFS transporter [Nonomuraea soli]|uniref:MFS family permease n=1 Tax=Nonomuraea soli TaxID=1032476 RepID=A0A7W0HTD4_9ACTN|nr:MFS transporter [Nonomuraea soli]MBA2895013.1 MFS family permease [Nonomuraea soli]